LAAALCACAAPRGPAGPIVPLVATSEIPGDFLLVQRLRVSRDGGVQEIDAAVQNACGELVVMLLSPFGKPAAVVRQRGVRVSVDPVAAGVPLPFEPERILLDVERTYFVPTSARADGVHEIAWRGERIREVWRESRLQERSYEGRAGGGRLRVTYPDGMSAGDLPLHASLENETSGYRIDVATIARTQIACPPRGGCC